MLGACDGFDVSHERSAYSASAGAAMHKHLADIGAVGLIVRHVENELDRAADSEMVFREENGAIPGGDSCGNFSPEGLGTAAGKRIHEPDRCTAGDAVDEHIGER